MLDQLGVVPESHVPVRHPVGREVPLPERRGADAKQQLRPVIADAVVPSQVASSHGACVLHALVQGRAVIRLRTAEVHRMHAVLPNERHVFAHVCQGRPGLENQQVVAPEDPRFPKRRQRCPHLPRLRSAVQMVRPRLRGILHTDIQPHNAQLSQLLGEVRRQAFWPALADEPHVARPVAVQSGANLPHALQGILRTRHQKVVVVEAEHRRASGSLPKRGHFRREILGRTQT